MITQLTIRRRRVSGYAPALIALVAVAIILTACTGTDLTAPSAESVAGTQIATVAVGDLSAKASASGRLEPQLEADVALRAAGTVTAIYVDEGDTVAAGDPLLQLDTTALARAVAAAEQTLAIQTANLERLQEGAASADIAAAEAQLAGAQAALDALVDGPSAEQIASAEANVRAAEANLAAAQAQYGQLFDAPGAADVLRAESALADARDAADAAADAHRQTLTCAEITAPNGDTREICASEDAQRAAEANAVAAQAQLAAAQAQLDAVNGGPDAGAVTASAAGVAAAEASLTTARLQLQSLLEPATDAELAQAAATVAQAEASLDSLRRGSSANQIAAAAAQVEQARIALQRAELDLAHATLTAPFAGVVTAVHIAVGETAAGPAVTLIDPNSVAAVVQVDEIDLALLAEGQPATVTVEAFPNTPLAATVTAIAPVNTATAAGAVTYDVTLALAPADLLLRSQMSVTAQLVTAERRDVLLLPNSAVTRDRQRGTASVDVVAADGTITTVPVTLGLRDGGSTEIVSGVAAGDRVLLTGAVSNEFTLGTGAARRQLRPEG